MSGLGHQQNRPHDSSNAQFTILRPGPLGRSLSPLGPLYVVYCPTYLAAMTQSTDVKDEDTSADMVTA